MKVRALLIGLLLLGLLLLALHNMPWHLDDKDQAKQAFTSFEMVEQGHWWFQHTPTGKIATKPPLAGWISAGVFAITRQWEAAWRLPGFLCALALLVMLWRAGNGHGHAPLTGALAAGAFALNHFSQRLATLVRTDMLLAFTIFLAGWLIYEKVRTDTGWTTRDRWTLCLIILASMLTKGPIVYVFLLPGLLAFWLITRRRTVVNPSWSGVWPWALPLVAFAAWAGVGIALSPEFYDQVVRKEFLGRFDLSDAPVHQHQPVYFYLGHLLGKFAPWSVVLLGLHFWPPARVSLRTDPSRLWLVCWALGGLLAMSLVPSKRADRIFPVIPPLCLLTAVAFAPALRLRQGRRLAVASLLGAAALTTASTIYTVTTDLRNGEGRLADFGRFAREKAAATPERLAVLNARDEGLLLYTQRPGFTKPEAALAAWRAGRLDWVLMKDAEYAKRGQEFVPGRVIAQVPKLTETFSGYVLIARAAGDGNP